MRYSFPKSSLFSILIVVIFCIFVIPQYVIYADSLVIRGVLFYSPTCPACHLIISEVIPPLVEQYPDQLEIIGIDVTQDAGTNLYQSAVVAFDIPDERIGVPTLVIGELVLVGAKEIPDMLPGIIQGGIETGGIDWPDIPGLEQALAQIGYEGANQNQNVEIAPANTAWADKIMLDPIANLIAIIILAGMLFSVVSVGQRFLVGKSFEREWPAWVLPVLALIGFGIAIYLTYIELTHSEAVCGPVGNCNTVQESSYAYLFGVIPVGIMGAVGYAVILIAWLVQQFGPQSLRKVSRLAIWGMAWFGVLFSIYLTFLEPFVIGASCTWCLTSAVIMTLILWASTGPALDLFQSSEIDDFYDDDDEESEGNITPEDISVSNA